MTEGSLGVLREIPSNTVLKHRSTTGGFSGNSMSTLWFRNLPLYRKVSERGGESKGRKDSQVPRSKNTSGSTIPPR